ncbi:MAG TPA: hypothetical protein VFZ79_06765 [Acidimicrobiales bacterium]
MPPPDRAHPDASRAPSAVRKRARGVTVLPSAEWRSLRSDPRWSAAGASRAERLLGAWWRCSGASRRAVDTPDPSLPAPGEIALHRTTHRGAGGDGV